MQYALSLLDDIRREAPISPPRPGLTRRERPALNAQAITLFTMDEFLFPRRETRLVAKSSRLRAIERQGCTSKI